MTKNMYINNHQNILAKKKGLLAKAVGDIFPGDCALEGVGICSQMKRYGSDFPFKKLGGMLDGADLLMGNLEGAISRSCVKKSLRLCGLPEVAVALRRVGFKVLSMANNHSFDHGPEIFNETLHHCEEAGLKICGLRGDSNYYSQPVIVEINSITVGVLAYNWVVFEAGGAMGKHIAIVEDSVVNYTWNRNPYQDKKARTLVKEKNKNVIHDIKRLRKEVDILILMPHWGYEWTIYPPFGVMLEARTFINMGVDLIIGSHPHVPQGIEKYKNGLIVYSLGNFLFDGYTKKFQNGMVLKCTIKPGSIESYDYFFIRRGRHFQPELASEKEQKKNRQLIDLSNKAISSKDAERLLNDDLIYREYERQYKLIKLKKIYYLFVSLLKNPFLIIPIYKKVVNLFYLIVLRLKGKKIRW